MKMIVGIVAAAALTAAIVTGAPGQAEPTHQGWDSWWHDWWHSDWLAQHGWLHAHCRTFIEKQSLPGGQVVTGGVEWC